MIRNSCVLTLTWSGSIAVACAAASAAPHQAPQRFDFGAAPAEDGTMLVAADTYYTHQRGYGIEPVGDPQLRAEQDYLISEKPFFFSVRMPEGAYEIEVTFAAGEQPSRITVKAETRRLVVHALEVPAGERVSRRFAVHTRTPRLDNGHSVALHEREVGSRTWDDRLTLEFNGRHPAVDSIEIAPVDEEAITVFLAGDSTVTDQSQEPWSAWGQMLPAFFGPEVAIANHAESGRTLRSFRAERRWKKLLEEVRPGDYVFIQFGHNDMKEEGEGIGPWQSFSQDLRRYVAQVRKHDATPVLVTPMHRRWFNDDGRIKNTFGDYPDAMRKVAGDESVTLIDLQKMSRTLYETLGRRGSTRLFVHYPAGRFRLSCG